MFTTNKWPTAYVTPVLKFCPKISLTLYMSALFHCKLYFSKWYSAVLLPSFRRVCIRIHTYPSYQKPTWWPTAFLINSRNTYHYVLVSAMWHNIYIQSLFMVHILSLVLLVIQPLIPLVYCNQTQNSWVNQISMVKPIFGCHLALQFYCTCGNAVYVKCSCPLADILNEWKTCPVLGSCQKW